MSEVDERIVRMQFDNSGFEAGATKAVEILGKLDDAMKFDGAAAGLDEVQKSMSNFNMDSVTNALETSKSHFSAFEQFGIGIFRSLGNEVVQFGHKIVSNITHSLTEGATDGFKEYELQMGSLQTISANSGESMEVITANLDELNEYADKTIYNFSQMTQNIGRFTAAGLGVEESTKAIKGFANMAALAGAGSQETSRGMYQLSQAMAAGVVKLQDWKSIQNASIDTAAFKDILMETARVMGTDVDAAIEKQGSFNASLQEGWLTADVMSQALEVATMSTRDYADETKGMEERLKQLADMGYSEDIAKKLVGIANAADDSAREVRTWTQLVDTVKEAIGSGWANTWKLIVGDFDEATELFTTISQRMDAIVSASADARNGMLKEWKDSGGRDALIGIFANLAEAVTRVFLPVKDAFSAVFGIGGQQLAVFTENIAHFLEKLVISTDTMNALNSFMYDFFTIIHSIIGIFGNALRVVGTIAVDIFYYISDLVSEFPIIQTVVGKLAAAFNRLHVISDNLVEPVTEFIRKMLVVIFNIRDIFTSLVQGFVQFFEESSVYKSITKWVDKIKSRFSGLSSFGELLKSAFNKFIYKPFDELDMFLRGFGGDDRIQFFKDWFKSISATFGGPFSAIFKLAIDVVGTFIDILSGPLASAIGFIQDKVTNGFSFENPFKTLLDFVSGFNLTNPFAGLEIPKLITDKVSELSTKFNELTQNTNLSTDGLKDWIKEAGSKIKTGGKNRLTSVLTTLSNTYDKLVKYFSKFKGSGKSFTGIIQTVFEDIVAKIKEWLVKISNSSDEVVSSIGKAASYIFDRLTEIPGKIKSWFSDTSNTVTESADGIAKGVKEASENTSLGIMGFFDSLPSLSEIIVKIGTFFGNIKNEIVKGFSELFSRGEENTEGAQAAMGSLFDFSRYKIVLPDLKTPVSDFITGIGDALELFPTDTIDEIVTKAGGWAKTIGMLWTWMNFNKWLGSLAVFNKGLGKEAGGIGDFFTNLPEAIKKGMENFGKEFGKGGFTGMLGEAAKQLKDGMTLFGKAFDPWGKKTKARAFLQISEGILMLAGALFILSKIPADDISRVAQAMAQMGIAVAGFALFVGWLAKLTGSDLNAVGIAVAGFGAGLLALVAALWLFTKIPVEDLEGHFEHFLSLIFMLGVAVGIANLGGGQLLGAAAAFVALAAAMTIMLIPVEVLGHTKTAVLNKAIEAISWIAGITSGCIFLLSQVASDAGSIAAGGFAMLAMATSITLMLIPVEVLGHTKTAVLNRAIEAIKWIAAIIAGCIGVLELLSGESSGFSILASTVAMLGLVVATTAMIVPIYILGKIPIGILNQGRDNVAAIGLVMVGLVGLMGYIATNALGIAGAAIGMMLMNVAIAGLVAIVVALSFFEKINAEGIKAAIETVGWVVAYIASLALVGFLGAGGLAALAGALVLFSAALVALGVAIFALQSMVDWTGLSAGMQNFIATVSEMGHNIIAGIRDAIANAPGEMVRLAADMARSFIEAIEELFDMHSPSQVMAEEGDNVVQGFLDGISNKLGELMGSGEETGGSFLEGVDLADLPNKMAEKAAEFVNSFIDNINVDEITTKGEQVVQGFLDGLESDIYARVEAFPQKLWDSIVGGVKSLFGINSPSTVMAEQGRYVLEGFTNGLNDETLLGNVLTAATTLGNWVLDGIRGLPEQVGLIGQDSVTALSGVDEQFGTTASSSVDTFTSTISAGAPGAKASAGQLVTNAKNGLLTLASNFTAKAKEGYEAFSNKIEAGGSSAKQAASSLVTSAKNGLGSLYNDFHTVGENGVQGFINGLGSKAGALYNKAMSIGRSALDAIKSALGIASPSKEFAKVGVFSIEGLIKGMDSQEHALLSEGEALANALPDAFANAMSALSVNVDDLIDTDYNPVITPVIDPTQFDSGMGYLNSILNNGLANVMPIGDMDYNAQFGGKLDDLLDSNRQVAASFASNSIDYTLLGVAVANALIQSGVHVEMDGGELMGYLAGQIQDTRRMYS